MKPRKVLIAEDDTDIRETIADVLALEGYHVEQAADGAEAIAHLQAADLQEWMLLLDLMMPRVSGHGVLKFLEETGQLASTPVVVLSALPSTQLPPEVTWLRKPVDLDQLLEAVESCANQPPAPEGSPRPEHAFQADGHASHP